MNGLGSWKQTQGLPITSYHFESHQVFRVLDESFSMGLAYVVHGGLRRELMLVSRRMELPVHLTRLGPGSQTNLSLTRAFIRGRSEKMAQEQVGSLTQKRQCIHCPVSLGCIPWNLECTNLTLSLQLNTASQFLAYLEGAIIIPWMIRITFCWRENSKLIKIGHRIIGWFQPLWRAHLCC